MPPERLGSGGGWAVRWARRAAGRLGGGSEPGGRRPPVARPWRMARAVAAVATEAWGGAVAPRGAGPTAGEGVVALGGGGGDVESTRPTKTQPQASAHQHFFRGRKLRTQT